MTLWSPSITCGILVVLFGSLWISPPLGTPSGNLLVPERQFGLPITLGLLQVLLVF